MRHQDHGATSAARRPTSRATQSGDVALRSRIAIRTPPAATTTLLSSSIASGVLVRTDTGANATARAAARGRPGAGRHAPRGASNRDRDLLSRSRWRPWWAADAAIVSPLAAHAPTAHLASSALHRRLLKK